MVDGYVFYFYFFFGLLCWKVSLCKTRQHKCKTQSWGEKSDKLVCTVTYSDIAYSSLLHSIDCTTTMLCVVHIQANTLGYFTAFYIWCSSPIPIVMFDWQLAVRSLIGFHRWGCASGWWRQSVGGPSGGVPLWWLGHSVWRQLDRAQCTGGLSTAWVQVRQHLTPVLSIETTTWHPTRTLR